MNVNSTAVTIAREESWVRGENNQLSGVIVAHLNNLVLWEHSKRLAVLSPTSEARVSQGSPRLDNIL